MSKLSNLDPKHLAAVSGGKAASKFCGTQTPTQPALQALQSSLDDLKRAQNRTPQWQQLLPLAILARWARG
jgi:hypothetical protein